MRNYLLLRLTNYQPDSNMNLLLWYYFKEKSISEQSMKIIDDQYFGHLECSEYFRVFFTLSDLWLNGLLLVYEKEINRIEIGTFGDYKDYCFVLKDRRKIYPKLEELPHKFLVGSYTIK